MRALVGHRQSERNKKHHREPGGESVCRYSSGIPKWLPDPNECNRERQYCQRKTSNHSCAEDNDYILERYKFGGHEPNPSAALIHPPTTSRGNCITTTRPAESPRSNGPPPGISQKMKHHRDKHHRDDRHNHKLPVSHGAFQKSGATVLIVRQAFLASQCQTITGYERAANEKWRTTKAQALIRSRPRSSNAFFRRQTFRRDLDVPRMKKHAAREAAWLDGSVPDCQPTWATRF